MGRDSTYMFDTGSAARVAAVPSLGHAYRVAVSPDGRYALIPAPELGPRSTSRQWPSSAASPSVPRPTASGSRDTSAAYARGGAEP